MVFCRSSGCLAPQILADDINAVDAFDQDLGLEWMGPDIVALDQQGVAAECFNATKNG